jgi:hypothetical protein
MLLLNVGELVCPDGGNSYAQMGGLKSLVEMFFDPGFHCLSRFGF